MAPRKVGFLLTGSLSSKLLEPAEKTSLMLNLHSRFKHFIAISTGLIELHTPPN